MAISFYSATELAPTLSGWMPAQTFLNGRSNMEIRMTGTIGTISSPWTFSSIYGVDMAVEVHQWGATGYYQVFSVLSRSLNSTEFSVNSSVTPRLAQITVSGILPAVSSSLIESFGGMMAIRYRFNIYPTKNAEAVPITTPDFPIYDYITPKASSFEAYRSDAYGNVVGEGTRVSIKLTSTISRVNGYNTASYSIASRVSGSTVWSSETIFASGVNGFSGTYTLPSSFPITTAYEVRLTITDRLSSTQIIEQVSTGKILMHLKADGTAISIGAYATMSNRFSVSLPTNFLNSVQFNSFPTFPSAIPTSIGGTGGTTRGSARNNLGILGGYINVSVNGQSSADYSVSYSSLVGYQKAYSYAPSVVASIGYAASSQNVLVVYVLNVTATSFTLRVIKTSSGNIVCPVQFIVLPAYNEP